MKSIQSRLASGLIISLIIVFLFLGFIVSNNIQKLSENYIASRIEHDIETLLSSVSFEQSGTIHINEKYLNPVYSRPFSGHYYLIQHNNKQILSRSIWDKNLVAPRVTSPGFYRTFQKGPENQNLITITARFKKQNQDITISIAEDLSPISSDILRFKNDFTILSIAILFILVLVQVTILRRGLKPLRTIHNELNALEQGSISQLTSSVPGELKPVVSEINHLSSTLHKRIKRSRDALSDLSHAVKKPLTLLQQFSDKQQSVLDTESKDFINQQITAIHDITDRILKRARVAGNTSKSMPFKLREDLPLLIKTIKTMYPDKNIVLNLDTASELNTKIDREDMLELLGNLIENAWKWTSKTLNITIRENDTITIIIEDDGPGTDSESLNELAQRGVRLDESVKGYGFGLAISSDIIKDYEGKLEFSRSENLGGFMAKITLPTRY